MFSVDVFNFWVLYNTSVCNRNVDKLHKAIYVSAFEIKTNSNFVKTLRS